MKQFDLRLFDVRNNPLLGMLFARLPSSYVKSFEEGLMTALVPEKEEEAQFAVSPRFDMAAPAEYPAAVVSLLIQWLAFASKALSQLFLQLLESATHILARLHIAAITLSPRILPVPFAQRA